MAGRYEGGWTPTIKKEDFKFHGEEITMFKAYEVTQAMWKYAAKQFLEQGTVTTFYIELRTGENGSKAWWIYTNKQYHSTIYNWQTEMQDVMKKYFPFDLHVQGVYLDDFHYFFSIPHVKFSIRGEYSCGKFKKYYSHDMKLLGMKYRWKRFRNKIMRIFL
jgi:hypothetical protein